MTILLLWLLIWELFTRLVDNSFLLVGPIETLQHMLLLMKNANFMEILYFSSFRILSAYFLSFALALLFALIAYRYAFFEELVQAPLFLLRSLPVASFVIILLFFLGRSRGNVQALSFFRMESFSIRPYPRDLSANDEQCEACNGISLEKRDSG